MEVNLAGIFEKLARPHFMFLSFGTNLSHFALPITCQININLDFGVWIENEKFRHLTGTINYHPPIKSDF